MIDITDYSEGADKSEPTILSGLCPLMQLVNHSFDCDPFEGEIWNFFYNKKTHTFDVHTSFDAKKGEQVAICYQKESNWDLLRVYGFAAENNPFDEAELEVGS